MEDARTSEVEAILATFNTLNDQLNPICHLLALLGAHHILHVSGLRVNVKKVKVSPLQARCDPESG